MKVDINMPFKDLATRRDYQKANSDKMRQYNKNWRELNQEKERAKSKRNQTKPRYKISKALRDAERRCIDLTHKQYKYYGAKGIKYLLNREEAIIKLFPEYEKLLNEGKIPSLDRIDSAGNYEINNIQVLEFIKNCLKSIQNRPHL